MSAARLLLAAWLLTACVEDPHVCGTENHRFERRYTMRPAAAVEIANYARCGDRAGPYGETVITDCTAAIDRGREERYLGEVCPYCGQRRQLDAR